MFKIFQYALILTLLLGSGFESLAAWQPTKKQQVEMVQIRLPVDLSDTEVLWDECGGWNGFYFPGFNFIVLCEENLEQGVEVARFILLHELGHSFTFQQQFTYARWEGNYEAAADEFAAVMSIVQGHPKDLLKMAKAYRDWGKKNPYDPKDPHPPMELRAERLERMFIAYTTGAGDTWNSARQFWHRMFLTANLEVM